MPLFVMPFILALTYCIFVVYFSRYIFYQTYKRPFLTPQLYDWHPILALHHQNEPCPPLPKIPVPKLRKERYKLVSADLVDEDTEKLFDSVPEKRSTEDRGFRSISWIVFVLGLIMMLLPTRRAPTGKECAAQVGVWCGYTE